jgi:hypothetical protein
MLWIFDQTPASHAAMALDALGSVGRQWLLRTGWWKIALAVSLAVLQVMAGGFGLLMFGRRKIVATVADPAVNTFARFSPYAPLAHQPLTLEIVMFLAVFVTAALVLSILGLALWQKNFALRRRGLR